MRFYIMTGLQLRSFINHQVFNIIHGLGHIYTYFLCIVDTLRDASCTVDIAEMRIVFTVDAILHAFTVHCLYAVLL
jgi:hypothetical protein